MAGFTDTLSTIGQGVGNFFTGNPLKTTQASNYTPNQLGFMQNNLQPFVQNLLGQVGQNFGQNNFEGIANKARHDFTTQTMPSIATRFAGMGSGNQSSGAYKYAQQSAGKDLDIGLAALGDQHNLQQGGQQQQLLIQLLSQLLHPAGGENLVQDPQEGFNGTISKYAGKGLEYGLGRILSLLTGGIL